MEGQLFLETMHHCPPAPTYVRGISGGEEEAGYSEKHSKTLLILGRNIYPLSNTTEINVLDYFKAEFDLEQWFITIFGTLSGPWMLNLLILW